MPKKTTGYTNESIVALKGADRVRKRPAVIFGSVGTLQTLYTLVIILFFCYPRCHVYPSNFFPFYIITREILFVKNK